ncbi:TPR repeat-containing protein precursor [Photorhabdus australis subsp. thailandensis]|uniref:TPR repeat-containing protein n=1 Tax=Photorhabdus australis subsp. thailandensis TaxID=2805096 RepID=A0A1C0U1F2_9GAMM|nr:porin family protein [Photorhabdus australis]OCQ51749.1 TPR repeat-containing protein precursor [Photorhabdus australis subsp. thailandensis]
MLNSLIIRFTILISCLFVYSSWVLADEDTGRRLWHNVQRNLQEQEKEIITDEIVNQNSDNLSIVLNGLTFSVENNVNDIGQALYLAVNHQQVRDVERFLSMYQKLPGHDTQLVHFAQANLARSQGDLVTAEQHYQAILHKQPDFTRAKLELARVYYENQKNKEANLLFNEIFADNHNNGNKLPPAVIKNIISYQDAISLRNSWRGSFAVGYIFNDNTNMSPNKPPICMNYHENGDCKTKRSLPMAKKASGISYDATLRKIYPLNGHHGIFLRSMTYGESYRSRSEENENTTSAYLGYNYKALKNDFLMGPIIEFNHVGNRFRYRTTGAKAEWMNILSQNLALNLEGEYKQFHYHKLYNHNDGNMTSVYATLSYYLTDQTITFAGGDWVYKTSVEKEDDYQQRGIRAGISTQLYPGINAVVFTALRQRQFGDYSVSLNARRKDNEQLYSAILSMPKFEVFGLTPVITYRYRKNNSNVDWLYSYSKNEVLVKFEKYF